MATETTYITIGGMTCSACTNSVENALKAVPGVVQVDVSLITEEAVINHTTEASVKQLEDAIDDIGFFPTLLNTESTIKKEPVPVEEPPSYKTTISVSGMTCSNCTNAITSTLQKFQGVEKVEVSLITEDAVIIHDDSIQNDDLKNAIEDCGFDAIIKKTEALVTEKRDEDVTSVILRIGGMTCTNCSNNIEAQVTKLSGIKSCYVALATEEARIEYDSNALGIRDIIQCIEDCGFDATMINKLDYTTQLELLSKIKEIQYWRTNLIKLLYAGIPIVLLGHIIPFFASLFHFNYHDIKLFHGTYLGISVQFVLGSYVQLVLAKKFYSNSFAALLHGSGTMDLLITVSTTIVYTDSVFSMLIAFVGPGDYAPKVLFATSAMLFIFVSLGKWVESKAKGNTSTALSKLLSLTPTSCTIVENPEYFEFLKQSGESIDPSRIIQKQISIDLLQKNDIAIILPGSKIPSDGACVYGESEVDESLLTGESMPVPKCPGSRLIGGSLNSSSTIYMKIELLGARTQLQQIVQLVKDAQMSKAPVQRYADSIAAKFVPTILLLSFSTLVFWTLLLWVLDDKHIPKFFLDKDTNEVEISKILQVAIAVIVVACPCALGLAAPTAVMVGTGVGASNGILIKGGEVLERASDIDCIVFDKTGTLTQGRMKLIGHEILKTNVIDELTLWSILYAIESNSEHPAGIAIAKGALSKIEQSGKPILPLKVQEVKIHVGSGISAVILDELSGSIKVVKIGTGKYINEGKLDNNSEFQDALLDNESEAHSIASVSHISINDSYVGYIELADTIRPDSRKTIQHLMSLGYIVAMVTGDNARTANYVAKLAGIPSANVCSNAMPQDKIAYVERLQSKGFKVAFVGDGINDAPALVQAELGIAISSGTDIAIAAADIVLLSSSADVSTSFDDEIELGLAQGSGKPGIINVCSAFSISKQTFRTIKLNFLLAIVYNVIMLPIAMGCLIFPLGLTMHPMIASATMACSSVSVVLNSLRLKNWKPELIPKADSGNDEDDAFNIDLENAGNEGKTVDDFQIGKNQVGNKLGVLGRVLSMIRWKKHQSSKKGRYQRL